MAENSIMGIVIAEILILGVGIPITQATINDNNYTGMTATIVALVPAFLAIGALMVGSRLM